MKRFICAPVCVPLVLAVLLAACSSKSMQHSSFVPLALERQLNAAPTTAAHAIKLFQVFDGDVTSTAAKTDASRYQAVWGSSPALTSSWVAGNAGISPLYYTVQETDADYAAWGNAGHDLAWWQAQHPSWVLYACTASGTPTKTPAFISQLPQNVPLDIRNPDVVKYQLRTWAAYAHQAGYSGLAVDLVQFHNMTGTGVASGFFGCGIYKGNTFVARYSSITDPQWTADTLAWLKQARQLLISDPVIGPYHLRLVVNHPAGNPADPNEQAIFDSVDGVVDETGFTDYGNYTDPSRALLFPVTANWIAYAATRGIPTYIIDKLGTTPVTPVQLEYAIATYLLANAGGSSLFVGDQYSYGVEQYHPEYGDNFGTPCGAMYGGAGYDAANPDLYYRRYSNAFVVVNAGSLPRSAETAKLPAGHALKDLEGRSLSQPLSVRSNDAYVLWTSSGCT